MMLCLHRSIFTHIFHCPVHTTTCNHWKYGAVIERFDVQNIETVPIFIPTKELSATITGIIREYKDCLYRAFCKKRKSHLDG